MQHLYWKNYLNLEFNKQIEKQFESTSFFDMITSLNELQNIYDNI